MPVATPTPAAATPPTPSAAPVAKNEPYDPKKLWGEPVYGPDPAAPADPTKKILLYVKENSSQTHPRTECIMVKLTGFTIKDPAKEKGRLRVAVWDSVTDYAKEGVKPYRASSHYARDAVNNEMKFQMCGFSPAAAFSNPSRVRAAVNQMRSGVRSRAVSIPKNLR